MNTLAAFLIVIAGTIIAVTASYFIARVVSKRNRNIPQIRAFTISLLVCLAVLFLILWIVLPNMLKNS